MRNPTSTVQGQTKLPVGTQWRYFWKGFRKGIGQGALFSGLFFGLGFYVLLFQHRWVTAGLTLIIGCTVSYLGMKVWIQEDETE